MAHRLWAKQMPSMNLKQLRHDRFRIGLAPLEQMRHTEDRHECSLGTT